MWVGATVTQGRDRKRSIVLHKDNVTIRTIEELQLLKCKA